jgi:hypothetical protein
VRVRALRGISDGVRLPIGINFDISRDGRVVVGFMNHERFGVYRPTGEPIAQWNKEWCNCVTGDDGSWVAFRTRQGIEKWDVATRRRVAVIPRNNESRGRLRYENGYLYTTRSRFSAWDLEANAMPMSNVPHPGAVDQVACGARFAFAQHSPESLILWDRVRQRSVFEHRTPYTPPTVSAFTRTPILVTVSDDGRLALVHYIDTMLVVDLATNTVRHEHPYGTMRPDPIFRATANVIAETSGTAFVTRVHTLDWEPDETADGDPLEAAWADARAPIVDAYREKMTIDSPSLRAIARHHPELEIALAVRMPPEDGMRWARRALEDPEVAARSSNWHRLADIAVAAGDLDAAADAAAEGLARNEYNDELHAALVRIQALRAPQRP